MERENDENVKGYQGRIKCVEVQRTEARLTPHRDETGAMELVHHTLSDYDSRFRREAFRWLGTASAQGTRAIKYHELENFRFEGERISLRNRYKGIWRPRQLDGALSITTSYRADTEFIPYDDSLLGARTSKYHWMGEKAEHPDNAALRDALRLRLPMIWYLGVGEASYLPIFPVYPVDENVSKRYFTLDLGFFASWNLSATAGVLRPNEAQDRDCRRTLLRRMAAAMGSRMYGNRCLICELDYLPLLETIEINPERKFLGDAENFMLMCVLHARAFQSRVFTLDGDYRVRVSNRFKNISTSETSKHFAKFDGIRARVLPSNRRERPSKLLLNSWNKGFS